MHTLTGTGGELAPVGHDWDAIRMTRYLGLVAAEHLGDAIGTVIVEPGERRMYVLVPPGTTASWEFPGTRALGQGNYLPLPPPARTQPPGPYWLQRLSWRWKLATPEELLGALTQADSPPAGSGTVSVAHRPAYITPECRLGQHRLCHGNTEIRRIGAPDHEVPVETLRCDCGCRHPRQKRTVGARRPV
ncbi:hypothetical protein [Streptomyces sp. NPDC051173]|uniref:hypothetical protein n=1 Tax=Streptomyces sp. NPDC051173 TaxID=3155164 RepID=UPI00344F4CD9